MQSPIDGSKDVQFQIDGSSVRLDTLYDPVQYRYTRDADPTSQHAVIEISFDIRTFLDGSDSGILDFEWGPNCYNDFLNVTVGIVPGFSQLPEPGSLAVFGIGLLGLAAVRRRSKSRRA